MATLSLTVLPAKAMAGGRNKVRVAVAHNSKTRYIVTDVIIDKPSEWRNGKVVKRPDAAYLNTKLRTALNEIQRSIDELPYIDGLSCSELVESVKSHRSIKHMTLGQAVELYLEVSTAKESTKTYYRYKFSSIMRFIPKDTLVTSINPIMLKRYIKKRTDLKPQYIHDQIAGLASVLNMCQANGYTHFTTLPTNGLMSDTVSIRTNWLSPTEMRYLRDVEIKNDRMRMTRDAILLSYYLGGINIIDLAKIDFRNCNGVIKYERTKTERISKINPFVEFDIPVEAQEIIDRYIRPDGSLSFCLDVEPQVQSHYMFYFVRKLRKVVGMPQITYYSGRKSFAQHAFNLGISTSVIDYILGHSLGSGKRSCLYSYIKVTPAMASDAVRKVLDFLAGNGEFD